MPQATLARESHYCPRAYMRPWSLDAHYRVWGYRTLVPTPTYRVWELRSTKKIARQRDLYTSVWLGRESDRIERWLNEEVETPALGSVQRLVRGEPLSEQDRLCLARYIASLDARTPVAYVNHAETMSEYIRGILNSTIERSLAKVDAARRAGRPIEPPKTKLMRSLSVKTRIETTPEGKPQGVLDVQVTVGRESWLDSIERLVNETSDVLRSHDWRILRPADGWHWITSDNPVIRLNYYEGGKYDFRGGWGNAGSEILLPLSPECMLYTQIDKPVNADQQFSLDHTFLLQKMVAEHAHRWVIASRPNVKAEWFRPRRVSVDDFATEENAWREFHERQKDAERIHEGRVTGLEDVRVPHGKSHEAVLFNAPRPSASEATL